MVKAPSCDIYYHKNFFLSLTIILTHRAVSMRKQRIDTIRLKLLKIAARVVKSARYKYFKLCSNCPYKKEFYETLENIHNLQPQLE